MAAPWPLGLGRLLLRARRGPLLLRALHAAAPPRDVLLFQHERGRFFTVLGLFCAGQAVFWASLTAAALSGPPVPAQPRDADRRRGDLRAALWRYGLAAGCGAVGKSSAGPEPRNAPSPPGPGAAPGSPHPASAVPAGALVLAAGLVFSLRSVRSVVLRAGGQQVTLTTHAPFGLGAQLTIPLSQVSCMAHRGEVPAMLPLKVKGRRFYFLLDKAGHFPNTQLFDHTVGAYRSL